MSLLPVCVFGAVLSLAFWLRRRGGGISNDSLRRAIAPDDAEIRAMLDRARDEEEAPKRSLPFVSRLEAEARKAGVSIAGRSLLFIALITGAAAFTLAYALVGSLALSLAASALGLFAPRAWLSFQKKKRSAAISAQMEGALALMASALRGGSSLAQAIEQAAQSVPDPLGLEFRRADRAIQIGLSPADALTVIREHAESPDVDLMVTATQILSKTGGNLAEIYDKLAETVRERKAFRQGVKAATAQARMSGMMVSLMPVGLTLLVRVINPHYFDPMLSTTGGKLVFLGAFGLIGLGWLVVQRMFDVATD